MSLIQLVVSDIKQAIESFDLFHQRFAHYFATKTRNMADTAKQYLQGQLQYQRWGNMVQFEKVVPESNHQSFQHFASNSPWGDEPNFTELMYVGTSRAINHLELLLRLNPI